MKYIRPLTLILLIFLPCFSAFALTGADLSQMMQNLQRNLGPVFKLLVALSYVMGIWFMADAIFRLKKYGQARTMMSSNMSLSKPIVLFCLGLGLLYLPTMFDISVQTFWAYGSASIIRYPQEASMWDAVVHPVIDLIRLFGLIAFIRGMVILTRFANENPQPGTLAKGLMHIIGGIFAINIVGTVDMIKATFGLS